MKKSVLFIGSVLLAGLVQGQITFGVHANGLFANVNSSSTDPSTSQTIKDDTKGLVSWKAGAQVNIPINATFSFVPQLNILIKGAKKEDNFSVQGNSYVSKTTIKLSYLELPLYVLYAPNANEGFFGGIGPVLSYGLSGKSTVTSNFANYNETQDIKFDGKADASVNVVGTHLNAFEFGAGLIAGYKLNNGLFINGHYNLGLSNIEPHANNKFKNIYAGIGIGYIFKK